MTKNMEELSKKYARHTEVTHNKKNIDAMPKSKVVYQLVSMRVTKALLPDSTPAVLFHASLNVPQAKLPMMVINTARNINNPAYKKSNALPFFI